MMSFPGLIRTLRPAAIPLACCAALLPSATMGVVYQPLNAFTSAPAVPSSGLLAMPDGSFYGSTSQGGAWQHGTIYKMVGGTVTTLASFDGANTGDQPLGGLIKASDGNFYGVTGAGGTSGHGTFFQLTPQGGLTAHAFQLNSGSVPMTGLVQGADGHFYGLATPGPSGGIILYQATPAGDISQVAVFDLQEGTTVPDALTVGADGNFYGTTGDGAGGYGTAFMVTPAGAYTRLASFSGFSGHQPGAGLTLAADGNFYGTTRTATNGTGTVFSLTPSGDLALVATLAADQGIGPAHLLHADADGWLYGTTSGEAGGALPTIFRVKPGSPPEKLSDITDDEGGEPAGGLVQGYDGSLYGAGSGGTSSPGMIFCRSRFGITLKEAAFSNDRGSGPTSTMVLAEDGYLYGTTETGGTTNSGTMFRALPEGDIFHLSDFNPIIGSDPTGPLCLAYDGSVYGTTVAGGSHGAGAVYRYTTTAMANPAAAGIEPFASLGGSDGGSQPTGGVLEYGGGTFIGTTASGTGGPILFQVNPAGEVTTLGTFGVLAGSSPHPLGSPPIGSLFRNPTGEISGVTREGGGYGGGTIYSWYPSYHFMVDAGDIGPRHEEFHPNGGLVPGQNGWYWGTMEHGGPNDQGGVFRFKFGEWSVPVAWFDGTNGANPKTGLAAGVDGNFYGTTSTGGAHGYGTIFQVTPDGTITTVMDLDYIHGAEALSALSPGPGGHLYGLTHSGGTAADGTLAGGGQFFRLQFGPSVTTLEGRENNAISATLRGLVNPNGFETTVEFQYLPASDSEDFTSAIRVPLATLAADAGPTTVSARITGLQPGGYYDYRIVASNAENSEPQAGKPVRVRAAGVDPNAGPDQFLFTALDTDQDNLLTPDEWRLIYVTPPRKEAFFGVLDQDDDGTLQYIEFAAAPEARSVAKTYEAAIERTRTFLEIDTSEDNLITREEIARMWRPGTPARTIDAWWARAGAGESIDFYQWLHLKALPSLTTYGIAKAIRAQRADIATRLDTDQSGDITFTEFSHLYRAGTKVQTIDAGWRAANATPRGAAPPVSMTLEDFVEAPRLPKLVVY